MSTTTENLKLFKYDTSTDSNLPFNINEALNENWDKIDEAVGKGGYHPNIFDLKWSDHLINDIQWLRADTFSWQSGTVYSTAYNKLVEEYATGSEETEGDITFKRSANGFKIATTDYESAILSKYNSDGIAWYYILDEDNEQFKLPRTSNLEIHGQLIDSYISGTSGYRVYQDGWCEQWGHAFGSGATVSLLKNFKDTSYHINLGGGNSTGWGQAPHSFTYYNPTTSSFQIRMEESSSLSSGMNCTWNASGYLAEGQYSDDIESQYGDYKKYLYFYVGEYSQTAIEQTAGITTEQLNAKVDLDASNFNSDGKSILSGYPMPSERYAELTIGATGTSYTAPANGWFCGASNTSYMIIEKPDDFSFASMSSAVSISGGRATLAVKKGDVVKFWSDAIERLRFYYAEGEV